jgi:hypothetical protein
VEGDHVVIALGGSLHIFFRKAETRCRAGFQRLATGCRQAILTGVCFFERQTDYCSYRLPKVPSDRWGT